jgi:peptidoglycan/xylan/chitin deacetylase (PgdA/CDA1 family)
MLEAMDILLPIVFGLTVLGSAVVAGPTVVMEWKRSESPEVLFYVGTREPVVALTIDDGPSEATPEILEILAEYDARATFFVIGEHVRERPELTRRLLDEGHELGHHMMLDEPSIDLPPETFRARFREMDEILDDFGGSTVFRPASGWYDDRMVDDAAELGYRTVLGSVYPFDAQVPFPKVSTWYMRQLVGPGSVLILHDGPRRGPRTAEVLRSLLPELRARGIDVVPVSELQELEAVTEDGARRARE